MVQVGSPSSAPEAALAATVAAAGSVGAHAAFEPAAATAARAGTQTAAHVCGPASGTGQDTARFRGRRNPEFLARETANAPWLDPVLPAADEDRFAVDQRLSDLGAAALQHTADGLARYAHGLSGLLVAQPLEVDETNRLELVDSQLQLLELPRRDARWLEQRDAGDTPTERSIGGRGTSSSYGCQHARTPLATLPAMRGS